MLVINTPQCQSAVLQPFPTVPQINELNPFVAFLDLAVVVGRIEPRCAKGVVGCQQPLDIAAYCLFGTEALDTCLSAFAV